MFQWSCSSDVSKIDNKSTYITTRYIKVKVEHYLLFMFSPPKISWVVSGIKYICLHLFTVFYLVQPSSKQIIYFDFRKQNSVLPIVFYVPYFTIFEWEEFKINFFLTHCTRFENFARITYFLLNLSKLIYKTEYIRIYRVCQR